MVKNTLEQKKVIDNLEKSTILENKFLIFLGTMLKCNYDARNNETKGTGHKILTPK